MDSSTTRDPTEHEMRVKALDEDLEYYYTKRLVPLILQILRRRHVGMYSIFKHSHSYLSNRVKLSGVEARDLDARIEELEKAFREFVKGIGSIDPRYWTGEKRLCISVDDKRKESGAYDEFFRIEKSHREGGDLLTKIDLIDRDLGEYAAVLRWLTDLLLENELIEESALADLGSSSKRPSVSNGSRLVARAWSDAAFRKRLLSSPNAAIEEIGIPRPKLGVFRVLENTDRVHNVIVCFFCSCYPYEILGNSPSWYKQEYYKKGIISEPRKTLLEMFDLRLPQDVELIVHDHTSDVRYMVLPVRPPDTEGMSENELEKLVTQESLIGVGLALTPGELVIK
ncbi:MAG: nitrile hydratase subunit alpha [Nitrososphaerales archaeon]